MKVLSKNKSRIFTLVVAAALVLAGCGSNGQSLKKTSAFKAAGESEQLNGIVAENDKFQLLWDDSNKLISVYDKSDGSVFSTTKLDTEEKVNEFGIALGQDPMMLSDILIRYLGPDSTDLISENSNIGAVDSGHVTLKSIKNGLRVTYFFDAIEISIPVDYTISNDGLSVSVDPKKIRENADNKVISVSIAPFACSYKNDASDSYLFIPSGSGALIYPTSDSDDGGTYSQEVYGTDPLNEVWEKDTNEQSVKLPVYGAKNGNSGLCAIISSGAESASIEANYNSSSIGSSAVYSTFRIRGSSTIRKTMFSSRIVQSVQYTDDIIQSACRVDFYPLKGNDANYSGMAKLFREKALSNSKDTAGSAMNLVIYGGATVNKSFLGIPYKSVYAATTVKQAEQMIKELTEETGATASVILKGFGKSGIDIGKIGGGYTVSNKLGSVRDLNNLGTFCKENNIGVYFDFDMVRQSADGWFSSGDTASAIDKQTVYQYIYDKAVYSRDLDSRYSLISRKSLVGCQDKLISKTAKWDIDGIALDSLSNIAYSDYGDLNYISKSSIGSDVGNIFSKIRESGKKVASVSANYYAAGNSDAVFEAPSSSNKSDGFAVDVPFYQMVFKGKTDIGCESVNLAYNRSDAVLKSVESGAGVTYALYYSYDTALTDTLYPVFTTGTYGLIKQGIVDEIKELKGYYESVADTFVKEHTLITDDVRKTVFENGTVAYVNYSDKDYTGSFGTVAAHDYLIVLSDR